MDEISAAELMELAFSLESSIDTQFQVWMAATFALVVASYAVGKSLSMRLRAAVGGVYLLAALALFMRLGSDATRFFVLSDQLEVRGIELSYSAAAGYLRTAAYWLGTTLALIFVFSAGREKRAPG